MYLTVSALTTAQLGGQAPACSRWRLTISRLRDPQAACAVQLAGLELYCHPHGKSRLCVNPQIALMQPKGALSWAACMLVKALISVASCRRQRQSGDAVICAHC